MSSLLSQSKTHFFYNQRLRKLDWLEMSLVFSDYCLRHQKHFQMGNQF